MGREGAGEAGRVVGLLRRSDPSQGAVFGQNLPRLPCCDCPWAEGACQGDPVSQEQLCLSGPAMLTTAWEQPRGEGLCTTGAHSLGCRLVLTDERLPTEV